MRESGAGRLVGVLFASQRPLVSAQVSAVHNAAAEPWCNDGGVGVCAQVQSRHFLRHDGVGVLLFRGEGSGALQGGHVHPLPNDHIGVYRERLLGVFSLTVAVDALQDMLHRVHEQRPTYNNNADVSGSAVKTTIKVMSVALRVWLWLCEATHVVTMRVITLAQVLPDVRLRVWAHGSPRGYVHVQFQVDAGSSSTAVGPLL